MFTLEQIHDAHAKVKSGADFPKYVQELVSLWVAKYEIYVTDGHAEYFAPDNTTLKSEPKYTTLIVMDDSNKDAFEMQLKAHQAGKTDYLTFCQHAAETGVEKWTVNTQAMTCTYFDKQGRILLIEAIPMVKSL